MAKNNFYAVRKGHRPGIYTSWSECEQHTKGFPNAQYKGFKTKQEAEAYLQGGQAPPAPITSASAAKGTGKFYAIARGIKTGIFQGAWDDVKQYVAGYSAPVYKGFSSFQDAQNYLDSAGGAAGSDTAGNSAKRQKREEPQTPAPPPAFTNPQQQQQRQQQQPQAAPAPAPAAAGPPQVTIYFDGGSRGNPGRAGYGYAVFDRATNERIRIGCRPLPYGSTNNEAEYGGMIAGLRYCLEVLGCRIIVVRGDSQLVVRQMTGQYQVKGERLQPLHREAMQLVSRTSSWQIEHVYRDGNQLADALSNLAMDSDAAVDQVVVQWASGTADRAQLAALLAQAAGVDQEISAVNALRTSPSFMATACALLALLWDNMPEEEVAATLTARGWNDQTGGPPAPPLPSPAAAAAGAGGDGGGGSSLPGGSSGGGGGRGMQAVAAAAVTLGPGWGAEIRRQEELIRQQQQQQGQQGGAGSSGGSGGGGYVAGSSYPAQRRLRCYHAQQPAAEWQQYQQQYQQQQLAGLFPLRHPAVIPLGLAACSARPGSSWCQQRSMLRPTQPRQPQQQQLHEAHAATRPARLLRQQQQQQAKQLWQLAADTCCQSRVLRASDRCARGAGVVVTAAAVVAGRLVRRAGSEAGGGRRHSRGVRGVAA